MNYLTAKTDYLKAELTKFEAIYKNTSGDARKIGYKRALRGIIKLLKNEIEKRC